MTETEFTPEMFAQINAEHRDIMLALAGWFTSQEVDLKHASWICARMAGVMAGVLLASAGKSEDDDDFKLAMQAHRVALETSAKATFRLIREGKS
jgi:hypothetical protein